MLSRSCAPATATVAGDTAARHAAVLGFSIGWQNAPSKNSLCRAGGLGTGRVPACLTPQAGAVRRTAPRADALRCMTTPSLDAGASALQLNSKLHPMVLPLTRRVALVLTPILSPSSAAWAPERQTRPRTVTLRCILALPALQRPQLCGNLLETATALPACRIKILAGSAVARCWQATANR